MTEAKYYWRAEVTVSGIHAVTDDEYEQVLSVTKGVIRHDTHEGDLHLTWRFANGSPDINDAISQVSVTWRKAIDHIYGATDPVCTDYRVRPVEGM